VLLPSRTDPFSAGLLFEAYPSFSLSYGVILPSSFTVVLSMPLCPFIHPPVSVSCTVSFLFVLSGARFFRSSPFGSIFFTSLLPLPSRVPSLSASPSRLIDSSSLLFLPFRYSLVFGALRSLYLLALLASHLYSPFSSQLGSVLPNSHLLLCWNLWIFGHLVSLLFFRYSCQHSYF